MFVEHSTVQSEQKKVVFLRYCNEQETRKAKQKRAVSLTTSEIHH
jgi:hypothetical protein